MDRTVVPRGLVDWSLYARSYQFSYWKTEHEDRYIELVSRAQMSGETLWALKDGHAVFNKRTRKWEYEPMPSSRTDRFLADCRMTKDEARRIVPREVWYLHQHARRKVDRIMRVYRWRQQQNVRKAAMQEVVDTIKALEVKA